MKQFLYKYDLDVLLGIERRVFYSLPYEEQQKRLKKELYLLYKQKEAYKNLIKKYSIYSPPFKTLVSWYQVYYEEVQNKIEDIKDIIDIHENYKIEKNDVEEYRIYLL